MKGDWLMVALMVMSVRSAIGGAEWRADQIISISRDA
jgi:hypothetical protein